ncbi:FecR domain-containing protein [Xylophilus sp. GW821-FHT01B05]
MTAQTKPVAPPPAPEVLREAARWLVRLHSGTAQPADWQALERWRAQDTAHEAAWQRAERMAQTFGAVPAHVGLPVLAHRRRLNHRAALRVLGLFAAAPAVAWLAWQSPTLQLLAAAHHTATGERRDVLLADGSRVLLNTASAFDLAFDARQRLLRLRAGEILVSTAPDAARSFLVETPQGRLRALGTRFCVRLMGDETRVAVIEGAVEVVPRHGAAQVLRAGEQTRLTTARAEPPAALASHALAWTQGVLYADGMRLDDFLAELSRYRPGILRCDPAVAGLRISGAFQLQDTEYVLAMLRETLPVELLLRTRWWVTVVPA